MAATYDWFVTEEAGLQFDGSDDYVAVPDHVDINTGGPYPDRTIGLWFKTNNLNQSEAILYEEGGSNNGFSIYLHSGKLYAGGWTTSWGPIWLFTDNTTLQTDTWYHVALVLRGSTESTDLELWFNGSVSPTYSNSSAGVMGSHSGNIGIGGVNQDTRTQDHEIAGTGINAFAGSIDDVSVFNSALDSDGIGVLASTILSGNEAGLVGLWAFDEMAGTQASDDSPNNNTATLTNGPTWPSRTMDAFADSSGSATYVWTSSRDAVFGAEFQAQLTTVEGLTLSDTDISTVAIQGGAPIARPGGPYAGGISGGNFANVQLLGNPPNTTETDTAGDDVMIQEWEWNFDKTISYNQGLDFDGPR